ncbi:MAG: hypothetical protein JXB05_29205 [Myxococcaceae bacterium]|nr:hypothetical protein [Myxococcaceae bacterium]
MSTPTAISGAELRLAAAYARLAWAKGTPAEGRARAAVETAQRALAAVKEATHVVAERQCCGLPMTWCGAEWICTRGHD